MNNQKRQILKEVISSVSSAAGDLESLIDREQDAIDNMPENLTSGFKYEQMEANVEYLEGALDDINSALERMMNVS